MTGNRPIVIGLAGGIGSGKSRVAAMFGELGCIVLDSDRDARAALERAEVKEQVRRWWGEEVFAADGTVDRSRIAAIIFRDERERLRLEALVHPLVKASRVEMVRQAAQAGAPAVIVDAPLLFEAGVNKECDAVVFVEAPLAARLERVRTTRGWGPEELERRERAQWGLDVKRRLADHVVVNDSGADELRARVQAVFREIVCNTRPR